ncbi:MAG: hypothetical protein HUJ96_03325 [Marinilabiliaceae bacterium]|nr:hypothetical protein [Marinilabiliaceae bacterium]
MSRFFKSVVAFVKKYMGSICMGLLIVCIMQQCAISELRERIINGGTLVDKVEKSISNSVEIPIKETSYSAWVWIVVCIILLAAALYILYRFGKLPIGVNVSGKMWQDLQGRIVFTLNVRNNKKSPVEVSEAMVEFIGKSGKRRFRMPVNDFPMTLQSRTSHSVTVSLQRLFDLNSDLRNMMALNVAVKCNGKTKSTLPQPFKFK